MITDERLKWLSGPDYAKSEPGQIAAELLASRARIAALEAALLKIDLLGFGPCSMIVRGVMAAAETRAFDPSLCATAKWVVRSGELTCSNCDKGASEVFKHSAPETKGDAA